jgi:Chaperone of endosialidase/Secretion system C-terminal sorting domain
MRHIFIAIVFLLFSVTQSIFGQNSFFNNLDGNLVNITGTGYRTGNLGVGFTNPYAVGATSFSTALGLGFRARFAVRDGILAHQVSGEIGLFSSKWCGLGEGNPGNLFGLPNPYGLSIVDNNSVGFLNLFPEPNTTRKDLVLGFGISGGANTNRFVLRDYSGASASVGRDLMTAFPGGATSFNLDPAAIASPATLFVDAARDLTGVPKDIVISSTQRAGAAFSTVFPASLQTSVSAMGVQQNASLTASGIAVEGFRAQFPTFPTLGPPPTPADLGGAVNLQVVRSPFGGQFNQSPIDLIASQGSSNNPDYAELSWQDFGYGGDVSATDCIALPINTAQELDKFFISFRNNKNVNPFGAGNKLPVMTFQANGRVGIGTLQPTSGSGCTGAVYNRPILLDVNGGISSSGTLLSSDKRFKQNIKPVDDALSLIRRLQGTKYEFRTEEFKDRNFPQGNQYGFIAQDVEKVIPEMAFENSDGYYVVNYTMLIPVLTEAIKQQDKTITEQATTITELRTEIAELRSAFNDFKAGQAANGVEGYRLEQNAPNPFSQNTVIGYAVPAGTTGARVNVYDLAGRLVKSFNIADQSGQITINAGDMSNGLYVYDLQVNGRQILERKMTVVKD